jgi:N-methylhydantoinase A
VMFQDGRHPTKVFSRASLRAGHVVAGPAIIEEAASVTVVNPGQDFRVDDYGNLLLATI